MDVGQDNEKWLALVGDVQGGNRILLHSSQRAGRRQAAYAPR